MSEIKDRLYDYVRQQGFSLVGVADPALFERYRPVKSVSPAREFMLQPREEFQGCRTVLVAGMRCDEPVLDTVIVKDGLRAQFYYELIYNRLHRVKDWIHDMGGRAVTSGSISLKRAAVLAGLGKMCRNTLVAAPGHGSRVRWGALLTDLDLPTDEPGDPFDLEAECRECTQCVDACPVGAIGDCSVDFDRCVVPALDLAPPGSKRWRKAYEVQRRMGPDSYQECTICIRVCSLNRDGQRPGL